jgi:hypothetical protein
VQSIAVAHVGILVGVGTVLIVCAAGHWVRAALVAVAVDAVLLVCGVGRWARPAGPAPVPVRERSTLNASPLLNSPDTHSIQ